MSPLTLTDAATLLVQLDATDMVGLSRLRDGLTILAFENRVSRNAQPLVARAARLLNDIVTQSAPDPADTLREVHAAVNGAMRVDDTFGTAPTKPDIVQSPHPLLATAKGDRRQRTPTTFDELPVDVDRELMCDFLTECAESLVQAEVALLQLEDIPADAESVNTVFRSFHSVKGTSAFLGLSRITEFAHEAEGLLSRVRDREILYTRGCANMALRCVDMIKVLLANVEQALATTGRMPVPTGYPALFDELVGYHPERDSRDRASQTATVSRSAAAIQAMSNADATIRVRTDRLDLLIDKVAELSNLQSKIAADANLYHDQCHDLQRRITHAGEIVRELQQLSMSMRTVTMRGTFQKLARVVRDTAVRAGKSVQFITTGEDVELDRTIVELLSDPLVHMVRNAIDHGVESAYDRTVRGKSGTGMVRLSVYHASGNVVVELTDDGRGLHRDKLVKKAIEKGLIASDRGMSDSDVYALVFAPGLSTAETLTDISGRGVGMDVVRRNLEMVHGQIEITSTPDAGTTFIVRLPLILAATDGMLVRVGAARFIIPMSHIHMSFRPESTMLSAVIGRGEAVLMRGALMPIIRLHRLFSICDAEENATRGLLVIVGDGDQRVALQVDELLGHQQVVAQPLGAALESVPGVSGGAILSDGRTGMVLDVNETIALAHINANVMTLANDNAGGVDPAHDVAA